MLKNNFIISFFSFVGVVFLFNACNTTKHVPNKKYLLEKNTLIINGKTNKDESIDEFLIQRPNKKVIGVPLSLHFYNLGNTDFIESYQDWKEKRQKAHKFLSSTFSEKQAFAYRRFKKGFNKWFFKTFEAPVIIDSIKTKRTARYLKNYFFNDGYFKTKVDFHHIYNKKQRAKVTYTVTTGLPTFLDTINKNIASPILDSIYENHKNESFIKTGKQFNIKTLEKEADRLTNLFRNNGVYYFNKNAIYFDADTLRTDYLTNLKTQISNRDVGEDSLIAYKIMKVKKIKIFTDYNYSSRNKPYLDTVYYKGFTFISHKKNKYNPKLLANSLFIEPNTIYKDIDRELTRKHLRSIQNFRLVNIQYQEINNQQLETSIYLTPIKKYSLSLNAETTHSNIKPLGISGKIGVLTRNAFKGGEILKFTIQGSFLNSNDVADKLQFFNAWEVGADLSIDIPRFLLPFKTENIVPKTMSPKTTISLGTSLQKNIGLDKQKFTGIIDYNWKTSKTTKHKFELLNAQYIQNLNAESTYANTRSYFRVYSSEYNKLNILTIPANPADPTFPNSRDINGNLATPLNYAHYIVDPTNGFQTTNPQEYQIANNVINRRSIITEDILVPTISYEYTYNNSTGFKDTNFSFFRARVAASGNLSTAISKQTDPLSNKQILGIDIAQYFRTDLEYKKFWNLGTANVLAFRSFLGAAIPYGNSNVIPFSRSYFIGGPNDLRAWKIYDLGPGKIKSGLDYNVGNLKLLTSLEYRFKFINSINGAFFVDAGNTWDLNNASFYEDGSKFKGLSSLQDIAVGSGFGIRYDFNFLVFRLDLGFKTYEPYLTSNKGKWFQNYNFRHAVLNIGINYPF